MTIIRYIQFGLICIVFLSCKKDWLELKPDKKLVIPTTIQDCQALLNNTFIFNSNYPNLTEIGADNFYIQDPLWPTLPTAKEKNGYIWAQTVYPNETVLDWNKPYEQILYANVTLEAAEKITPSASSVGDHKNITGTALFFRAYNYYALAQVFIKHFNATSADTDLGLPLRLNSSATELKKRSTVKETYDQILQDLLTAKDLVASRQIFPTWPSKAAVHAMLARTYLTIGDYDNALLYAESCLQMNGSLMNYNTDPEVNLTNNNPFKRFNKEVLYYHILLPDRIFLSSVFIADTTLYDSYDVNDLRRTGYFRIATGFRRFKGSYEGSGTIRFAGLATDEIYLIRAECNARKGKINIAMDDLNLLLVNRWKTGNFIPVTASSQQEALNAIFNERRKELLFRGIRWTDLRRFNADPLYAKTLVRILNGQTYTLQPDNIKYVLPIPDDEVRLSGLQQNPR